MHGVLSNVHVSQMAGGGGGGVCLQANSKTSSRTLREHTYTGSVRGGQCSKLSVNYRVSIHVLVQLQE